MRASYEDGLPGYLEVILGANGLYDMLTRVDMVSEIFNYDQQIYNKLMSIKNDIAQKKLDLETTKTKQEGTAKELAARKSDREAKYNQSIKLLKDLEKNESDYKKYYNQLEREEAQERDGLNKLIEELSKNSQYIGGKLTWPAPGYTRITSPYGMRMHPILHVKKMHYGVDIGAPLNASIVAANTGTVIVAKYHYSYGNYIVIDHGGGTATLYAHLNKILVKVGQKVSKGQTIGKAGSTGDSTGPHLHFEVKEKVNGKSQNVDPMKYFR
jgi:murein DD-endopeptidase MepM/ murein hydrolase activator NlpD